MTPSFALSLSSEGVALLRRQPAGWALIEDAGFGDADFDAAMAAIHRRATEISPEGDKVLLVIPNDQIRYLDLPDPGDDAGARESAIRAALDGATPYGLDQLVYDWSAAKGRLFAAAVARETLDEAEAFALGRGFTPVGHVAAPDPGGFAGSVDFGRATSWTGDPHDRLPGAIRVIPADAAAQRPEPEVLTQENATPQDETADPVPSRISILEPASDPASPATPENAQVYPKRQESTAKQDAPAKAPRTAGSAASASVAPAVAKEPKVATAAVPATSTPPKTPPPAPLVKETGDALPDPRISAQSLRPRLTPVPQPDAALPERRDGEGGAPAIAPSFSSGRVKAAPVDDIPEVPEAVGRLRARQTGGGAAKPVEGSGQPVPPAAPDLTAPASAKRTPDIAPPQPRTTERATPAKAGTATRDERRALPRDAELERMTVFGARGRDDDRATRRPAGLIAAAVVLLAVAALAAWASGRFDDRIATLLGWGDTTVAVRSDPETAPAGDDSPAAEPSPATPRTEDATQTAAPPESAPQTAVTTYEPLDPEEAAATYAASGIWQRGPNGPLEPAPTLLGDVYVASIDPAVTQHDAVALPATDDLVQETALPSPELRAPPGLVFDLDERGLVRPSAEGTRAPAGHSVFSGLPPAVPPNQAPQPEAQPATTQEPAGAVPQEALPDIRPEARPEDIVESRERTQLRGLSRDELAGIRPVRRPATVQEEAAADNPEATATALAVTASPVPPLRPSNMAAIVQEADSSITQAAAAPAPRNVAPQIPSSANVAREATVTNALNLRQTNLIGIYGTQSNRRALVRLPNGSYQKVKVGDSVDGGRVAAIGETELRYVKGGRSITLAMPRG